MTAPADQLPSAEDQAAIATLRAHGYQVPDIQALARDQHAFAVRVSSHTRTIAPGVHVETRPLELGDDCFTNAFTLRVDLAEVHAEAISAVDGFHLPDVLDPLGALAAVSGSFSFISDDPLYQPVEPCLDFCCRAGVVVSLPTATKPAFLVYQGKPTIRMLEARGMLSIAGRSYRWTGSKMSLPDALQPGVLIVYGAANCRVRYTDHPRTGFLRDVDPTTNTTPTDPSAVDCVVTWTPSHGHRVTSVHPGGGASLFAGNMVLRTRRSLAEQFHTRMPVEITQIGGVDSRHIDSGISLGPSVADAAVGHTAAYDQCLGTSPFRDTRCARTLIGIRGGELWFQVLDGAPLTGTFRGTSPMETAQLCTADRRDPRDVYHLDGGQSSKIAFVEERSTRVRGSMHYLRWPRRPTEPFRWQGVQGRRLRSGFVLTSRKLEGMP